MSPSELNSLIWGMFSRADWYWWSLPFSFGLWILIQVYRLNEAMTLWGRLARPCVTVGCLLLLASPIFHSCATLALPFILFSFAVLLTQQANACAVRRHVSVRVHRMPGGAVTNMAARVARSVVAPPR